MSKTIKFSVIIILIAVIVLLILFLAPNLKIGKDDSVSDCRVYTRQLWQINLTNRSMDYKGSENESIELCGELYSSGKENVIVQLLNEKDRVVYEHLTHVALTDWYHTINEQSEIQGGISADDTALLDFYFPNEIEYKTIKLVNTSDNKVVAITSLLN